MSRYDWPAAAREEEGDDPRGRHRFVRRFRREFDPEGALAAGRAALQAPSLLGPVPGAAINGRAHLWQPLGPLAVTSGQAIGGPRITGRINMLAVHPDGNRVYAASGNGGVWYTNDAGTSWRSLGGLAATPGLPDITRPAHRNACGSITVIWGATEADDLVYVGTGETADTPDAQPGSSLGGLGILRAEHPATAAGADPWTREAKNFIGEGVCRIAVRPGGVEVVAATTNGLFERPAGGGDNWVRVAAPPFDTLSVKCADVLWTRGDASRPERLWVWVQRGASAGLWVRDAGAAAFQRILAPPAVRAKRAVLSLVDPSVAPDQFFVLVDDYDGVNTNRPPLLFRVACATNALPVATAVAGVPAILGRQGFYDIAIATHPTQPNRVVLGGNTSVAQTPDGTVLKAPGNTDDGAVVVGDVALNGAVLTFGHPAASRMVGVGVHADVHDLAWSNNGNRLWAACDGGVFRSDKPDKQVGFYAVNNGLAVIESNYLISHPLCEGYLVTGLQDNGIISRRSGSVWSHEGNGDGGGVAFDPLRPDRYLRQFHNGRWGSSDGTFSLPVVKAESDAAAFYSSAASIAHRRGVALAAAPNVRQVIVGTDRVWYTEDFGTTWFTLPSGTASPTANLGLDSFGEAVTVCRWQSPDVAWVLGARTLKRYARNVGSDAAGGPGVWNAVPVMPTPVIPEGKEKKRPPIPPTMRDSAIWTDVAVNLDPPAGAGQPPTQRGALGAVYVGTVGVADNADVDTLWWFDGTDKWFPTGLRKDPLGVPAPVTAIVCHPDFPNDVWVGTTVGVWRGVRTDNGANPPTWQWEGFVNGLPEAAVEDLVIFNDNGLVLLRAAIAARGVWELRLDVADVQDLTYLRAHDDDLRYRARAVDKKRDLVTQRSWHGSPDVRPREAPRLRPAPATLPWIRTTAGVNAELLRRFQAALRARTNDPRVQATGRWDGYFNEVLRDLGAPLAPAPAAANTVSINKAFWNLSMVAPHATAEPWGAALPTEADFADYTAALTEGDLQRASCSLPPQAVKVDIVIHQRGLAPQDGADVRITLLKWIDPKKKNKAKWDDHTTWFSGNVPWTGAVNDVLNSATGTTAQAFADGWSFVGTTNATRRQALAGQTLDALHPGIVTFDLNLSGLKKDTLVLLVAVIRSGAGAANDIALAPATLEDLAMTRPNVAVRSVRIVP
ncbi:MAG: hypothetical protein U0Y68_19060 [Blastocatellia bacterium]